MRRTQRCTILACVVSGFLLAASHSYAQGIEATATVQVHSKHPGDSRHTNPNSADVVVWLVPMQAPLHPPDTGRTGPYRLVQKDKRFTPHLLVVPTGTNVEFPNEDPFFHNVFSLFNGKRFDLGLYESGTTRSVRFDREGVSYIFCNIHPEMGAVVLALSTPYFGVSNTAGQVMIRNIPAGTYRLHIWSETAQISDPHDADRVIQIGTQPVQLGDISLQATADPMAHHKNKFGDDYRPTHDTPY